MLKWFFTSIKNSQINEAQNLFLVFDVIVECPFGYPEHCCDIIQTSCTKAISRKKLSSSIHNSPLGQTFALLIISSVSLFPECLYFSSFVHHTKHALFYWLFKYIIETNA